MIIVGVNAFVGGFWRGIVRFALFVVGYRVMQYGTYGWPTHESIQFRQNDVTDLLKTGVGIAASVGSSAYGFVLMGEAVRTQETTPMMLSGLSVIIGCMIGRQAVNDEVL